MGLESLLASRFPETASTFRYGTRAKASCKLHEEQNTESQNPWVPLQPMQTAATPRLRPRYLPYHTIRDHTKHSWCILPLLTAYGLFPRAAIRYGTMRYLRHDSKSSTSMHARRAARRRTLALDYQGVLLLLLAAPSHQRRHRAPPALPPGALLLPEVRQEVHAASVFVFRASVSVSGSACALLRTGKAKKNMGRNARNNHSSSTATCFLVILYYPPLPPPGSSVHPEALLPFHSIPFHSTTRVKELLSVAQAGRVSCCMVDTVEQPLRIYKQY